MDKTDLLKQINDIDDDLIAEAAEVQKEPALKTVPRRRNPRLIISILAACLVLLYTCGNLISIFGTFFLVGPKRQFHNMTHPYRRKAASIFLSSIVLTIVSLYVIHSRLLTIISVIIQFCSYIWYIATYIPYGQECLGYLTRRFFGGGNNDNTTS